MVADHDLRALGDELADLAGRRVVALLVHDPDDRVVDGTPTDSAPDALSTGAAPCSGTARHGEVVSVSP